MKLCRSCRAVVFLWLLTSAVSSAKAHGTAIHPLYPLNWRVRGEMLHYRSAGCADHCWYAEVRVKRTRALRARLSCDSELLHYYQPSASPKRRSLGSCAPINDSEHKMDLIGGRLKQLLSSERLRPPIPQLPSRLVRRPN